MAALSLLCSGGPSLRPAAAMKATVCTAAAQCLYTPVPGAGRGARTKQPKHASMHAMKSPRHLYATSPAHLGIPIFLGVST